MALFYTGFITLPNLIGVIAVIGMVLSWGAVMYAAALPTLALVVLATL